MKTIDLLKRLENYPVFTLNDVVKITGQSANYVRIFLHKLAEKKYIKRIERGKYTVHEDPLIFASLLYTPSYLSSWTGLRFYNMTTQLPNWICVMIPVSKKNIKVDEKTRIIFVKTKHMWGYEKVRYGQFDIFIADKEKTIIDCLLTGINSSDIFEALETDMDFGKLITYAQKTKNKALIKRVGFILEKIGKDPQELMSYVDNNYVYLDASQKKNLIKNSKWKVKYWKEYDRFGRA